MGRLRGWAFIVATIALVFSGSTAMADDAPFLGTDPASVAAKGEIYGQQWLNWCGGHSGESYNDFQSQTEFDYGLTNRLQLALTLDYDWNRTQPLGGSADIQALPGLGAEAIYVVLPTNKNPIGLALAVDSAFDSQSHGAAFRVLLTKYLFGFENVLNINFEDDWAKDATGYWGGSSAITFNYGIAHALDNGWTVAFELGNEFAFDELLTDGRFHAEANTFFFGPTLQYDCEFVTATMGMQAQLPWSNGTNATRGYTNGVERFRVGLRLSRTI